MKFKLNQLANDNYKLIAPQILKLIRNNLERVEVSVQLIIEKAANESKYRGIYSRLCKELCANNKNKQGNAEFRKCLDLRLYGLISRREEFESYVESVSGLSEDDKLILLTKRKKRGIGYLKLSG